MNAYASWPLLFVVFAAPSFAVLFQAANGLAAESIELLPPQSVHAARISLQIAQADSGLAVPVSDDGAIVPALRPTIDTGAFLAINITNTETMVSLDHRDTLTAWPTQFLSSDHGHLAIAPDLLTTKNTSGFILAADGTSYNPLPLVGDEAFQSSLTDNRSTLTTPTFLLRLESNTPQQSYLLTNEVQKRRPALPVRLKIPKSKVDAAIEHVGLTAEGAMDVPKKTADVGWYKPGTRPGERGSAVIAGHLDGKKGEPAVFTNLDKLQPGDKVYVEDEKGVTTTFVVRGSRKYDPDADASNVFGSVDDRAHLNLITCDGVWNAALNSYSDRLVVFADQE